MSAENCKRCGKGGADDRLMVRVGESDYSWPPRPSPNPSVEAKLCTQCASVFMTRTREWLGLPPPGRRR